MNQKLIKIVNLLPELLGTYGDQGNVATLSWRLSKRGIANEVIHASAYEKLPNDGDFYFLGGGEDDAQVAAAELLRKQNTLDNALKNGAQIFAVCAGFQLLGTSFPASGNRNIQGLSLLPVITEPASPRSVGELLTDSTITDSITDSIAGVNIGKLTGFENHAGQTRFMEKLQPLGTVIKGVGNHVKEACDGAVTEQIIATYMHGPALVRNPKLADYLLSRKLGVLAPIVDSVTNTSEDLIFTELHDSCVARALK